VVSLDEATESAREHLVLALDVSNLDEAVELAGRLRPWFSVVKVGLELFSADGPLAVDTLLDDGFGVFLDLKLHDIPTTVGRAARRIGSLGVSYATVHAAGGAEMLRAAVEGFEEGWAGAVANGHPAPEAGSAIGAELVATRASLAAVCGCLGVVCAASDLPAIASRAPGLLTAVPGIRLAGSSQDDQARAARPYLAIREGADLLVIGRTVTASPSPEDAAAQLTAEVMSALDPDAATSEL
jgi:orotidine-5'-phosphate decarboxylase